MDVFEPIHDAGSIMQVLDATFAVFVAFYIHEVYRRTCGAVMHSIAV